MTYKVTIYDKERSTGIIRDYTQPCWQGHVPEVCRGLEKVQGKRPWFIEFEGDVPNRTIASWALNALHPWSPTTNIKVNGKVVIDVS